MTDLQKDRLLELLADQTIFGLSGEELMELEELKKQFPDLENDLTFELTAAAISLSSLEVDNELPAALQTKIFANADEFFNQSDEPKEIVNLASPAEANTDEATQRTFEFEPKRPVWQWLGLGLAAAACFVIAISLWLTRTQIQPEIVKNSEPTQTPEVVATPETVRTPEIIQTPQITPTPETVKSPEIVKTPEPTRTPKTVITPEIVRTPEPVKTPAPALTATQKREQLITSAPDVIQTNWTSTKGDKRISGDVVWSNAQQEGYLRLRGMPVLDASRETYQLWIIDERNEKTPVSGGIFNMSGTGEIIIPINAKLRIIKPKQFAISKEKAGGVVATKPDRIVAVAKI